MVIKDGFLTKEGQKSNKNIEPRYVRLTRTDLQWFHNQEEAKHNDVPLGSIPFVAIYSVIPAKREKITSDIYIDCSYWKKKNIEKGNRKFVFGAKTENERDEWITSIEYMKIHCIHYSFNKKFANITLPILNPVSKNKKVGSRSTNFEGQTSLGAMLKKQTVANSQNPSSLRKLTSVRKGSLMQNLVDKKRMSSFSMDSYQMSNQEYLIKETAAKIKCLFNTNISYFFGCIADNAIKLNKFKNNSVGKTPECLKSVSFFEDVNLASPALSKHEGSKRLTTQSK